MNRSCPWLAVLFATLLALAGAQPPANDSFSNAVELVGFPVVATGDNTGATQEPGEPYPTLTYQSVWWRWTAPITGRIAMQSTGPWGYWLHVFTGQALTNLSTVFQTPDGFRLFDVTAGTVYHIAVGNTGFSESENGPITFSFWPIADNDRWEDAIELSGLNPTATMTNGLSGALWWKWTPPESCRVRISISGDVTQYGIYLGQMIGGTNFQNMGQDFWEPLEARVTSNLTYYILVDPNRRTNVLHASLQVSSFPQSDSFAGAIELVGDYLNVLADNSLATTEPGEPVHFSTASGKTLWWRWTAPSDGELAVTGLPDAGYAYPTLYRGDSLATLKRIAPATNAVSETAHVIVQSNDTFFIVVDGAWGESGNFGLRLDFLRRPANDDFEQRTRVTTNDSRLTVAFAAATRQSGEPRVQGASDATVWWTFRPPGKGTLFVTAEDMDGYAPMTIGVFTGNTRRTLRPVPGYGWLGWDVKPEFDYQVVVASDRYVRRGEVRIWFVGAPPNDNFAQRFELFGEAGVTTNTTLAATRETGEPAPGRYSDGRSVWYSWTAPDNGFLWLQADVPGYGPGLVSVFRGSAVSRLRRVTNSLPDTWPYLGIFGAPVKTGQTYSFRVETTGLAGEFRLALDFSRVILTSPVNRSASKEGAPVLFSIFAPPSSPSVTAATYVVYQPYDTVELPGSAPDFHLVTTNLFPGWHFVHGVTKHSDGTVHKSSPAIFRVRPYGDDFADPIRMSGYAWNRGAWLQGAGLERREPVVRNAKPGAGSIWLNWMAPANGTAVLGYEGYVGLQVSVYTGRRLGVLHPVRMKRESDHWANTFSVQRSNVYHIRFAGAEALGGVGMEFSMAGGTIMTSPVSGAVYPQFAAVPLQASTTEPFDNVAEFSFVAGTNVLASAGAPFTFLWTNAPPGQHAIFCRILTKAGFQIESAAVTIDVLPGNDDFDHRFVLSGLQVRTPYFFHGASRESGEPQHFPVTANRTVWWTWTAPTNGRVRISYTNWTTRPFIAVYTGDSISNLTDVAANGGLFPSARLDFDTVAGVTYQLVAAANEDGLGEMDLQMLLTPPNDAFSGREVLEGTNLLITGNTLLTSREPGEPELPSGCGYLLRSIWYSWTAPTNGSVLIDARGFGCVRIGAFVGTILTNLVPVPFLGSYYGSDLALWEVTAGETYEIVFDTGFNEIEIFSALFVFTPSPSNDNFEARIPLSGSTFEFAVDLAGSSYEPQEPVHSSIFGPRSVWYTWTPPLSGEIDVTTDPLAILNVYTGNSLESLVPIPTTVNPQRFTITAGVTYQIAIGPFAPAPNWWIYQGPMRIGFAPR